MSTIRVLKRERYFVASNEPFNDSSLSWSARGVMGYLLSKPNHWSLCNKDLENQYGGRGGGREAVESIIAELKREGYLRRVAMRAEGGSFCYESHVYENKDMNPDYGIVSTDSPSTGLPYTVKPLPVNPHLVNTELVNTELVNGNGEKPPPAAVFSPLATTTALINTSERNDPEFSKKYRLLRAAGVGSQKTVEILNRKDITAAFVQDHLALKQSDQSTGLIIHKILEGDPIPVEADEGDNVPEEFRHIVHR